MAIVTTNRANYNRPDVRIGKRSKPKRVASDGELHKLNKAIVCLNEAKGATTEAAMLAKVSEAFKITRDIWRGRSD